MIYLFYNVDYSEIPKAIGKYSFIDVLVASSIIFLLALSNAVRKSWAIKENPPLKLTLSASVLSLAYNNLLPLKAGDAISAVFLAKKLHKTKVEMFYAIILERFFDINFLIIFALLLFDSVNQAAFYVILVGAISIWVFMALIFLYKDFFLKVINFVKIEKIKQLLAAVHYEITSVSLKRLWLVFLGTFLSYGVVFLFYICCFLFLADLDITIYQAVIVGIIITIAAVVPSSPSSLGIFEGAAVLGLTKFGVGYSDALLIGFTTHLIYIFTSVLMLLVMFLVTKFKKVGNEK